jgi:phosphotransacetylase
MITNAKQLTEKSKQLKGKKTVAVAMANDSSVLNAVVESKNEGIIDAILVGNKQQMEEIAKNEGFSLNGIEIINEENDKAGCEKCVSLILEGKANFLMKGFVKTATLLKALLSHPEMKSREVLSHTAVLDIQGRDRLFLFTDGGMVIKPNKEQKLQIAKNMVDLALALNIIPFSFGFLTPFADSKVKEHIEIVKKLNSDKHINPIPSTTTENALQNLDGLVASSIEECNTITKSLTLFTKTVFAGLILGAKVPVCLVSRSDSKTNKKASLALGAIYSNREEI